MALLPDQTEVLDELSCDYFGKTNWMVRRSILLCYIKLKISNRFGEYLLRHMSDCGEKYE